MSGKSILTQFVNGFPVNPFSQAQIGLWSMTWQTAFSPQTPGSHFSASFAENKILFSEYIQ